jgi:F-type H+-transporting ATPase subunit a
LGIVPGFLSPTANLNMTIALALVVFGATHYAGARRHGVLGYVRGVAGAPLWLAPLMLPIHLIGELARPVSLSLRLYCNIFGEDQVIVGLLGLAALIFNATHHLLPLPIHLPIVLLAIFTSFVQALVFLMLSASYIEGALAGGH